jgi:hypothetical protein
MPLGRCVNAGTLVLKYGQQMWGLLRKPNPSSRRRGGPMSKHINGVGTNKNLVLGPDGDRNQELLCWRGPAAIF